MKLVVALGQLLAIAIGTLVAFLMARGISVPINRIIKGLSAAGEQVASASGQVSSSSQQLANGASTQASNLEEISSSLEEVNLPLQKRGHALDDLSRGVAEQIEGVFDAARAFQRLRVDGDPQIPRQLLGVEAFAGAGHFTAPLQKSPVHVLADETRSEVRERALGERWLLRADAAQHHLHPCSRTTRGRWRAWISAGSTRPRRGAW